MLGDFIITVTAAQTSRGSKVGVKVEDDRDIFPDVLVDALEMAADKCRATMYSEGINHYPASVTGDENSTLSITITLTQTTEGPVVLVKFDQNMSAESALSILRRAARFQDRKLFADQVSLTMIAEAQKMKRVIQGLQSAKRSRN